jgi:hypothetical protein
MIVVYLIIMILFKEGFFSRALKSPLLNIHIMGILNDSGEPEPWSPVKDSFQESKEPLFKNAHSGHIE